MPEASSAEASRPKLAAVPAGAREAREEPGWRASMTRRLGPLGIVAVLLVLAVALLLVQTRRVAVLTGDVEALEVELSAAQWRLDVYQAQLDQVRESLPDVIDQLTALNEAVRDTPEPADTPQP
jgi:hypothetical protein